MPVWISIRQAYQAYEGKSSLQVNLPWWLIYSPTLELTYEQINFTSESSSHCSHDSPNLFKSLTHKLKCTNMWLFIPRPEQLQPVAPHALCVAGVKGWSFSRRVSLAALTLMLINAGRPARLNEVIESEKLFMSSITHSTRYCTSGDTRIYHQ